MTEFTAAIAATIPPGDPHSEERREWVEAAAEAIAQVCLDHAGKAAGDVSPNTLSFTCDGIRAAYEHSMMYLRKKAARR